MSKAAASKKNPQQNPPESATKQNQNAPLQSPTQPQAQPLDQSQSPSRVQNNNPQIEIHQASSNEHSRVMEGEHATKSPTNVNPQHKAEDDDEVPADKDKLVEYLKNKLTKSEMTLTTLYVAIQIEKDKRDKLVKELEDRKDELHEVNQHEDNFLGEKVQDKMTTALKRALEDKVLADQEVEQAAEKLDEVEKEIQELDEKIQEIHKEKCQREYDADEAQYKANEQESIADNLKEVIGKLTGENQEKDKNISELNDEINDMKSVVEMLITAREKLNYYITDETPGQSRENMRNISTPQEGGFTDMIGARSSGQHYVSDEMERGVGRPVKTNRPPADDDFWYADPTVRKAAAAAGVGTSEVKRGGYNEPYPWQPKVQNIENINERVGLSKTVEYNAGPPSFRLPNINNPNAKSEYLYKNKEFMDEFGGNAKNVKNKNQNQPKKKAY